MRQVYQVRQLSKGVTCLRRASAKHIMEVCQVYEAYQLQ